MNKLLVVLSCMVSDTITSGYSQPKLDTTVLGYSWKPYKGFAPDDAVPGGITVDGKRLYIGKTAYGNGAMVYGHIDEEENTLYIAMDKKVLNITQKITILCSPQHEGFEWKRTDGPSLRFSPQWPLVDGGYEEGGSSGAFGIAVGRTIWNGGIFIGNAGLNKNKEGMSFADDQNKFHHETMNFEVLTYDTCVSGDLGGKLRKKYTYHV